MVFTADLDPTLDQSRVGVRARWPQILFMEVYYMSNNSDNLKLYESGRKVPDNAQTPFNNGRFKGTDINPMWRLKKLTELFGPCGVGWHYKVISERSEQHGTDVMAVVNILLYIKYNGEWSEPIYGTGGNLLIKNGKINDEAYKMALTDALGVACKALGIGADVYWDKDKTKYSATDIDEPTITKAAESIAKPDISKPTAAKTQPFDPVAELEAIKPNEFKCSNSNCNCSVSNNVARFSLAKYKRILCIPCQKKVEAENSEQS